MTEFLRRLLPYVTAMLLLAVVYLGWTLLERRESDRRFEKAIQDKQSARYKGLEPDTGTDLKLLQFYATPGVITEGEKAILCYGVSNAQSVRIEPGVDPVSPAVNRCFEIYPEATTSYKLTAADAGGKTVSASFVLQVKPDPDKLPKILYFNKDRQRRDGDLVVHTLCFEARNGAMVSIEPRVLPAGPLFRGCLAVAPRVTTTYKLTVADRKGRKVERDLVVSVP